MCEAEGKPRWFVEEVFLRLHDCCGALDSWVVFEIIFSKKVSLDFKFKFIEFVISKIVKKGIYFRKISI